jgi:hypothetical protein
VYDLPTTKLPAVSSIDNLPEAIAVQVVDVGNASVLSVHDVPLFDVATVRVPVASAM